jgi:hypothetical protein
MLLGEPPGGWPGTGLPGQNPGLTRFGAYQLQPYALPAMATMPLPTPSQPAAPVVGWPRIIEQWRQRLSAGWNGMPLPPFVDPWRGGPAWGAQHRPLLDPRLAYLMSLTQPRPGQPPVGFGGFGARGGEGGQGPRGGVGSWGGGL